MKVFLASHGHMAGGMASSVEILMGKQDKLTIFDAYIEGENETVEQHVEKFLSEAGENETKVLLSDLYGGSVNQAMMKYIRQPNTYLISGVTLSILMEILLRADELGREDLEEIIRGARELTQLVTLDYDIKEDSFF